MEKYKAGWKEFIALCRSAEDEKALSALFDLLLTVDEKESVAMRCLIVKALLSKEQTQRTIAKHLNVSIAKITRGSNEIKRMKEGVVQHLFQKKPK